MSETVDDLTISYEEDGIELVKELEKYVLSKEVGHGTLQIPRMEQTERRIRT